MWTLPLPMTLFQISAVPTVSPRARPLTQAHQPDALEAARAAGPRARHLLRGAHQGRVRQLGGQPHAVLPVAPLLPVSGELPALPCCASFVYCLLSLSAAVQSSACACAPVHALSCPIPTLTSYSAHRLPADTRRGSTSCLRAARP